MQQIECEVDKARLACRPATERVLQALEIAHAALVERYEFAVEQGGLDRDGSQRFRQGGHAVRPVVSPARGQRHLALFDTGQDAIAIEFDLVCPVLPARWSFRERGQFGLDAFG